VRHDVWHALSRLGRVARVELGAPHRHLGGGRGRLLRRVPSADLEREEGEGGDKCEWKGVLAGREGG
jgi:hypothetical protein